MEAMQLGQKRKLETEIDIIEAAKDIQAALCHFPAESQPEYAFQAIEVLGDPRQLYGSRKVIIHALGAFIFNQGIGISTDEEIYHGTYFGDVRMKGEFSRFAFIQHPTISSLCLSMYESDIIDSKTNKDFNGEHIRSGIFIPVHAIESVLAA